MRRIKSAFALEVFDHRNAKSERLAAFLTIYVQHFGAEHRTSTNELIDFLATPPADRTISYFGLVYGDKPCGFATFMHYPEGPIGIVDHLVLTPNMRGYGAFFSFCDLIVGYFEKSRITFDHILAEIMLSEDQIASTMKPMLLLRLMRMVGFRIAKVPYWAPDPIIVKDMHSCRAALLFASQPERAELSADEFNRLVRIIYRVHYAKWYERTMDVPTFASYSSSNAEVLERIVKISSASRRIRLNGMKNFDLSFAIDPYPRMDVETYFHVLILFVPAVVGLVVAFVEEKWIAVIAALISTFAVALFSFNPSLRRFLFRIFRLEE